jgi:hypothetical protein
MFTLRRHRVPKPQSQFSASIWLIVLGLLAVTALGLLSNTGGGEADVIPYSQFQQYLDANKVKQVTVSGNVIRGTLTEKMPDGRTEFTTVQVAQQALLTEQDNLAATLGTISSSLVGVYKALGGGWEIREGKELVPPDITETMAKRTNWGKLLAPATYNPPAAEEPKSLIRLPDW